MYAYYNGAFISGSVTLSLTDRGLLFGDGVFETMIYQNGKINYLDDHLIRLTRALDVLNIDKPNLSASKLSAIAIELLQKNSIIENARFKLVAWRKSKKQYGYGSSDRDCNLMLSVQRCDPIDLKIVSEIGYAQSIRNYLLPHSNFKTISSLSYIMAANECASLQKEELIILDTEGHLSECTASNLFWIEDGILFTPALTTGCVNGIMRKQLSKYCFEIDVSFKEVEEKPKVLKQADHVFCVNIAGINVFNEIESNHYSTKSDLLDKIIETTLDPR